MDRGLLQIYLGDHLAGGTGAVRRLDRMARSYTDLPVHGELVALATEVHQDRQRLLALMEELEMRPPRHRQALGRLGEAAGRLKLNGALTARSPLSPLVELEAMRAGAVGKLSLWQSLQTVADEPRLDRAELADLERRAREQLEVIERCHQVLAPTAFADES